MKKKMMIFFAIIFIIFQLWHYYMYYSYYINLFARFLFEFHAHQFESLDLPFWPADRSDFDVHGAVLDDKVHENVIL
jgi:hypothetical protein